jgi:hypothetical protein
MRAARRADDLIAAVWQREYNLVRDEGVAGSNPATPTNHIKDLSKIRDRNPLRCDRNGDRNDRFIDLRLIAS